MTLNMLSSCLCFLSIGITGVVAHTWFVLRCWAIKSKTLCMLDNHYTIYYILCLQKALHFLKRFIYFVLCV